MRKNIKQIFTKTSNGKTEISNSGLISYLNSLGYRYCPKRGEYYKIENGMVVKATIDSINKHIKDELELLEDKPLLEIFLRSIESITKKKLNLLDELPDISCQDDKLSIWLYFENIALQITQFEVFEHEYANLGHLIFKDDIIPRDYCEIDGKSQFETFCENICGHDPDRKKSLETIMGYLISRYNDPSNPRAIILLDEHISSRGEANGGTGKSLIAQAVSHVRRLVTIDGKSYKSDYQFKTNVIDVDTQIVCYDDVKSNFSLEEVFSMLTSGISIKKKYKNEIVISPENAPKILISSNYIVKGPGGSTDERRRCEFELSDYYIAKSPEKEFGGLFFSGWDEDEWRRFDKYMVKCCQSYLKEGLMFPKPLNLITNKLIVETNEDFVNFMEGNIKFNQKIDKRDFHKKFTDEISHLTDTSIHMFTKWLKAYARFKGLGYEDRSSGGKYYFWLKEELDNLTDADDEEE